MRAALVIVTLIVGGILLPAAAEDQSAIFSWTAPIVPETNSEKIREAENLTAQGDPGEALKIYKTMLINEETQEVQKLYFLGKTKAYVKLGNLVDAVRVLDQAIQRDPDDPQYWAEQAEIMNTAGYSDDNLYPVLQKAHNLDPTNTHVRAMLDTLSDYRQAAVETKRAEPKCEMCGPPD